MCCFRHFNNQVDTITNNRTISYDRSKSLQFDRLWHIIEIFQYAFTGSSHERFSYFSFFKLHNFLWHPVIGVKGSDVWSPTFFIHCVIFESLICVSTNVSASKSFCCPCTQIKIRNISSVKHLSNDYSLGLWIENIFYILSHAIIHRFKHPQVILWHRSSFSHTSLFSITQTIQSIT